MGAKASRPEGRLTASEVERLQRRFLKLSGGAGDGKVPISSFQSIPELGANPFIGNKMERKTQNDVDQWRAWIVGFRRTSNVQACSLPLRCISVAHTIEEE